MNKYKNKKVKVSGITFDSRKEARRYGELKYMLKAGKIKDLKRQVKYILIPSQRNANNRVIERECAYIADFVYTDTETGEMVVEDVKGLRTDVYKIKRKLMLERYGIRIKEV